MKKLNGITPTKVFSYVYLSILAVLCVFPLLWLLVSAFKNSGEMLANPTTFWPREWTLENFKTVLFTLKFTVNIKNSIILIIFFIKFKTPLIFILFNNTRKLIPCA